ncbi:MAG: decaprenyl-phosphate phosphoribosyltransferase [Candidatus Margulisiibacteriota bacterium]
MKQFYYLWISLRPKQWLKNLIIFAGILFALKLSNLPLFINTVYAFLLFCAVTSCIYLINDLKDMQNDKLHSSKKLRPLASGALSPIIAKLFVIVALPFSLFFSYQLNVNFCYLVVAYIIIMLGYTFGLKKIVILDAFIIAAGYVIRAVAGVEVIGVVFTPWFLVCAFLLALFIVFCKRRNEILVLGENAVIHRLVFQEYNLQYLDQLISVVTAAIILTYSLYTLSSETVQKFNTSNLIYTVPFVIFGLFRYLYLVYKKDEGGSAENLMLSDIPLIGAMFGWLFAVIVILYWR